MKIDSYNSGTWESDTHEFDWQDLEDLEKAIEKNGYETEGHTFGSRIEGEPSVTFHAHQQKNDKWFCHIYLDESSDHFFVIESFPSRMIFMKEYGHIFRPSVTITHDKSDKTYSHCQIEIKGKQ